MANEGDKEVMYGLDVQDTVLMVGKLSFLAEANAKQANALRKQLDEAALQTGEDQFIQDKVKQLKESNRRYEANNRALDQALVEARAEISELRASLEDMKRELKAAKKKPRKKKVVK